MTGGRLIAGPGRAMAAVSCALEVISGLLTVGSMVAVAALLERVVDSGSVSWPLVRAAVAGLVLAPLVHAGAFVLSFAAARRVEEGLRLRLADHLSRVPLGWFTDGAATARLRKCLGPDMSGLTALIGEILPGIARYLTTSLAAVIVLLVASPLLAVPVIVVVAAACALEVRRMGGRTDADLAYDEANARLSARALELAQGITVAKIYGSGGRSGDRFGAAADELARAHAAREADQDRRSLASSALASWNSILAIVVIVGALLVFAGWSEPRDLIVFLLLAWVTSRSVFALPSALMVWRRTRLVLASLETVLAVPELAVAHPPAAAPSGHVSVAFEAVGFGYGRDEQVLRDITLDLPAGSTTAVVGRSGSGKSTLVRLLPRFYDAGEGTVRVGGVDVRDLRPEDLYRTVGFVFQDVQLLRGTVAENIALARPGADPGQIERAAREAQIHDRIVALPRGYDSVVGEDAELSGGEAQRVSIARAILADAPVVVLDEPTSAADPESEAAVLRALARLTAGRTVLTIAHRMATIADADRIVVLEAGSVLESGTHAELIAADGAYAGMWARERDSADGGVR